jgi:F5/8 type C domain
MDMSQNGPRWLLVLCTLCFLPAVSLAQEGFGVSDAIYVDFGSGGNSTPGNWNNMTSTSGTIENAIADSGVTTDIGFSLPDRFNGVNENGTQEADASLGFPIEATRDSFYGNDALWNNILEPTAQLVISGLDPSASYELTFFCSRMGVSDVRQTEYAISGADGLQETLYLDPANNEDAQVVSKGIRPAASGEITIDIQKGPDNTNGTGFYYLGAFVLRVAQNLAATQPNPPAGATDVATDVTLGWTPGQLAATHNVYFGTDADAVAGADVDNPLGVLVSEGQSDSTYDVDMTLELGQTYYWRVDEVNGAPDFAVFPGSVWSFTAEPLAYAVANVTATASAAEEGSGPENTINGSGLNDNDEHSIDAPDMWLADGAAADVIWIQYEFDRTYKLHELWVWNYNIQFEPVVGFGLKDVTIETSTDGATWTAVADVPEFARATASPDYTPGTVVDLAGITAQYVRLTVNSGWGTLGQFGLSEVRFLYIPVQPRDPQPADGATDISPDTVLAWRAGRDAASHEVYLGTDPEALELVDTVAEATFAPGNLLFGSTYYWKVDEVNEAEAVPVWEGDLWSFATQEFVLIEGFENYNDDDNVIYEAWIDGWVNETGSTVGYLEAPFAETSIVHSGGQSMPLTYDNSAAPFYSETDRDLGGMDWDTNGADMLRLYVRGRADNDPGTLYVAVEDSAGKTAVVSYPDQAVVTTETWQEWVIRLADLSGVNLAAVRTVYVGVGDRNDPTAGGTGLVFIDDIGFGHSASATE